MACLQRGTNYAVLFLDFAPMILNGLEQKRSFLRAQLLSVPPGSAATLILAGRPAQLATTAADFWTYGS